MVKLFHLDSAEQVAHGHRRRTRVPIYIPGGASFREIHAVHEHLARSFITERTALETTVDDDPMRAPEGVVNLLQSGMRTLHQSSLDGELLAPHRPALVKDGVSREATQPAWVTVLDGELKVVARVSFVRAGQLKPEMLSNFGELLSGP